MMYRARPATKAEYPHLHKMVEEIAHKIGLPKPKLYIVPTQTPNAFATGPSPKKAVVACTEGILELLTDHELKGVLAHELSHVKNRDMLVTTIAATLAAVISYLAMMARYAAIFGGMGRDRDNGGNVLGVLLLAILAPIIALLLQLAISRSREYLADETGAKTIKDPHGLATALQKLEQGCRARPLRHGNPTTSSLFIVNPFTAGGLVSLFSTHPPVQERVKRLMQMKI
jgi:heat shock protein HtpX